MSRIVFSQTLDKVTWSNTRLVKDGIAAEVRNRKLTNTRASRNGDVLLCHEPA